MMADLGSKDRSVEIVHTLAPIGETMRLLPVNSVLFSCKNRN
jgi:hypothetical protein